MIPESMGVASEGASMASFHEAGPGASPRATLQAIRVGPIAQSIAKPLIVNGHYLHSYPGGTKLAFGVFLGSALLGVLTLGVGPKLGYQLVAGAKPEDCVTLTRLWLSDRLPRNSESRVLGIVLRALKRHTSLKFVLAYADPSVGHVGTIYQASGWSYSGISAAMPMYDLGDGVPRHSRSLAYMFGTHSQRHFATNGVSLRPLPQPGKHRYVYFLDRECTRRLNARVLPYPKKEDVIEGR